MPGHVSDEKRVHGTKLLTALSLERIDDIERGDRLSLGVLSVGDGVTDDTLEEGLEHTAGLLVDHGRDTLDTATTCKTTDGRLGDALDVVAQDLPVALGSALAEALATFAACDASACVKMSGVDAEDARRDAREQRVEQSTANKAVLTSSHDESVGGKGVLGSVELCGW